MNDSELIWNYNRQGRAMTCVCFWPKCDVYPLNKNLTIVNLMYVTWLRTVFYLPSDLLLLQASIIKKIVVN